MRILVIVIFLMLGMGLAGAEQDTTITSDTMEMETGEEMHIFAFLGNVNLQSEGVEATCDSLRIYAKKKVEGQKSEGAFDGVDKIVAKGNVEIHQGGRVFTSGVAEIFPRMGKIVLEENPEILDEEGSVKGYRITLFRDSESALVEGNPQQGLRPKVSLKKMPKLGIKKGK